MMSAFDDHLRAEAATWDPRLAPKGVPTCPNCRLHEPASEWGPHYVWCIAKPVLPVFAAATCGNSMTRHVGHPISLAHFDPSCPLAERLNQTTCPLFEAA